MASNKKHIKIKKGAKFAELKNRRSNLPKYGMGGDIFSGAASGAGSLATVAPPWGAIAGGIGGAILGGIGAKKKQQAQAAAEAQAAKAKDVETAFANYQPEGMRYAATFKDGGKVGSKKPRKQFNSKTEAFNYAKSKSGNTKLLMYDPNTGEVVKMDKNNRLKSVQSSDEDFNSTRNIMQHIPEPDMVRPLKPMSKFKFPDGGQVGEKPTYQYLRNISNLDRTLGKSWYNNPDLDRDTRIQSYVTGKALLKELPSNMQDAMNPANYNEMRYFNDLYGRLKPDLTEENLATLAESSMFSIPKKLKILRDSDLYKSDLDSLQKYVPEFYDEYNLNYAKPFLNEKEEMACGGKAGMKYPMGGMIPYGDVPVELEGGESGVTPQGEDFTVEGPSHANGGVPMELPQGTDVFSDRLKKDGKTYSELNKKLLSRMDKYNKTLEDPNATGISRKTAEKMLSKMKGEQHNLFIDQERSKVKKDGLPSKFKMAKGGRIDPTYGSYTPIDTMQLAPMDTSSSFADSSTFAGDALRGIQGYAEKAAPVISGIAEAAPAIYNIGQGLFGEADTLDPMDYMNTAGMAAASRVSGLQYDIDPMLAANRRSANIANRSLRGAARGRGELLSGIASTSSQRGLADSQLYAQKQNIENQYRSQGAQMASAVGSQDAQTRRQIADYNARARTAQANYLQQGLSQVSGMMQQGQREKNLAGADEQRMAIFKKIFPNVNF